MDGSSTRVLVTERGTDYSGFFFFIFKKKFKNICPFSNISKIYPGRPPIGRQAQCVIFFQICNEVLGDKKNKPCRPLGGATGACRPPLGRQGPVARWGGDRPPSFFFLQGLCCKFEEKNTFEPCRPPIGRPGYIFEIFQNGHIFLKF